MTKLVDPIKLLQERASAASQRNTFTEESAEAAPPYEIPMTPPLGAKLMNMQIAGTYRTPIPVVFDPTTRTTYPLTKD